VKDLVEYIARSLVSQPDEVKVEVIDSERCITLQLTVAEVDMGKVIGKEGRIAKAIRTVIKAASIKEDKPVYVEIA